MLKLKGQTGSGEWVVFSVSDIEDANRDYTEIRLLNGDNINYILTSTIQPADDPRKAMSEHEVLNRVQAMGEESLSPDNFEGLMRALGALKTTRNVDADSVDQRKPMLDEIREKINGLPGTDYSCAGDTVYIHQEVNRKRVSEIIDEMEAKL